MNLRTAISLIALFINSSGICKESANPYTVALTIEKKDNLVITIENHSNSSIAILGGGPNLESLTIFQSNKEKFYLHIDRLIVCPLPFEQRLPLKDDEFLIMKPKSDCVRTYPISEIAKQYGLENGPFSVEYKSHPSFHLLFMGAFKPVTRDQIKFVDGPSSNLLNLINTAEQDAAANP